jgi:hypothetical protein
MHRCVKIPREPRLDSTRRRVVPKNKHGRRLGTRDKKPHEFALPGPRSLGDGSSIRLSANRCHEISRNSTSDCRVA